MQKCTFYPSITFAQQPVESQNFVYVMLRSLRNLSGKSYMACKMGVQNVSGGGITDPRLQRIPPKIL